LLNPKLSLKFLKSLCVRVPPKVIPVSLYEFTDTLCPVKVVSGSLRGESQSATIVKELAEFAQEHPSRPAKWRFTQNTHRSGVEIFYTTLNGVFGQTSSDLENVKISNAIISASGILDEHFATPFGQALVACNWTLAFPHFVCHRVADLIFQFAMQWYLSPISRARGNDDENSCPVLEKTLWVNESHEDHWIPGWVITAPTAITLLAVRSGLYLCIEAVTIVWPVIRRCGGEPVLRLDMSITKPYTVFCYAVEAGSIWFAYCLMTRHAYICSHPFHLTILIFFKWFQLVLSCLHFHHLIEHLLPAWSAMTSHQSLLFLTYIITMSLGSGMAYYALPVGRNTQDTGAGPVGEWLAAFVRTFRLEFLSDFDEQEFEGVSLMVGEDGSIDPVPNKDSSSFHWVLKLFTLACGIFFPVVTLNLYVSLLGNVYNKALDHDCHIKGTFQMNTASRLLVQRYFFGLFQMSTSSGSRIYNACGWFFNACWDIFSLTWVERRCSVFTRAEGKDHEGFWIVISEEGLDEMNYQEEDDSGSQLTRKQSEGGTIAKEAKGAADGTTSVLMRLEHKIDELSRAQQELKSEVKELKGAVSAANDQPKKAARR